MTEDLDTRKSWIKKPKAYSVLLVIGIILLFWIVIARALIPKTLSALTDRVSYPCASVAQDMAGSPEKLAHVEMLYRQATAHLLGDGVPKDIPKAIHLYREAADAGHPQAQEDLGVIYFNGYGTQPDLAESAKWLLRAASQGRSESAFDLGLMYCRGEGVPKDEAEGAKWIGMAADAGHAQAQWTLGLLYGKGQGVSPDRATAMQWIRRAADQGDVAAVNALKPENKVFLDILFQYPNGVPSAMRAKTD